MQTFERKHWIDLTKAICMIGVYLKHSQIYVGSADYGYWVDPFYVNAFFFISGYLFFINRIKNCKVMLMGGGKILFNLLFKLVIPSILFASIVYLPKVLFHGGEVSLSHYIFNVWGGISYWFTSALVVSQLVLLGMIYIFRQKTIWFHVMISFVFFLLGIYLNLLRHSSDVLIFFPWFWKTGLTYTFIMVLGGLYGCYEEKIDNFAKRGWIAVLALIYVVCIVLDGLIPNFKLQMLGLGGICNVLGLLCLLSGTAIVVALTKKVKFVKWLEYIGMNSIVFYFCSGVYPAIMGTISHKLLHDTGYVISIVCTIISVVLAYVTSLFLNKYLPFVLDLRKLFYETR